MAQIQGLFLYSARIQTLAGWFASNWSLPGVCMGSETSEQVMELLKELAMLKELDTEYEANPTEGNYEAHRVRQQRHEEITAEIKALAKQSKDKDAEPSTSD